MSETTGNRRISMHATNKPFHIEKRWVYEAYQAIRSNGKAAGVDGQTLEQFEADLVRNLYKIWNRMSSGTYFPPPVRAVPIPKKNGGERIRQLNPLLRGWIGFYGRYAPSALYPLLRYVNHTLVAWAMRKFKRFKGHKILAGRFFERLAKERSDLFVHWRTGMVGVFA
jgi:Group II intron, maturase-specific domain